MPGAICVSDAKTHVQAAVFSNIFVFIASDLHTAFGRGTQESALNPTLTDPAWCPYFLDHSYAYAQEAY